jgi:pyrroline-5-carboxylate reductase
MGSTVKLGILGAGNIGRAMAMGLTAAGRLNPGEILLTRRKVDRLADLAEQGFRTTSDNLAALAAAETIIIAVEPQQLAGLLAQISPALDPARHLVISVVSGARIDGMLEQIGKPVPLVRAMPNTAIALGQSMTCLASNGVDAETLEYVVSIFDAVGRTLVIDEELMIPATALGACGVAFFLRAVRAASQGGIEIGFHPAEALLLAAQTALGAASLVLESKNHPEREIDSVTTPRGCTISGLNEMEHQGFSSAMIRGIITSEEKARSL